MILIMIMIIMMMFLPSEIHAAFMCMYALRTCIYTLLYGMCKYLDFVVHAIR